MFCPQGHLFHLVTFEEMISNVHYSHSPYRYGTRCDICSARILNDEIFYLRRRRNGSISGGVYHCDLCKFDLCSNCFDLVASFCQSCRSCGKNDSIVMITCGDIKSSSYTCNKCKKTFRTGFGLRCEECGTIICSECYRATAVCFVSHMY